MNVLRKPKVGDDVADATFFGIVVVVLEVQGTPADGPGQEHPVGLPDVDERLRDFGMRKGATCSFGRIEVWRQYRFLVEALHLVDRSLQGREISGLDLRQVTDEFLVSGFPVELVVRPLLLFLLALPLRVGSRGLDLDAGLDACRLLRERYPPDGETFSLVHDMTAVAELILGLRFYFLLDQHAHEHADRKHGHENERITMHLEPLLHPQPPFNDCTCEINCCWNELTLKGYKDIYVYNLISLQSNGLPYPL